MIATKFARARLGEVLVFLLLVAEKSIGADHVCGHHQGLPIEMQ